ncbi:MAG: D-glycero-beta-D-manno-heptose 1-phosphate adenylyltransferase [Thermocrinis sp.]|jgi:rfaE bifunctional protein nucleotidyltransferase chain/domain|uniref:D-glycero-beta-D-manno-heptose 1-phosphate adenylyltransferase n=1 Tax=Thermocrinis sp. TaxID=2024383 RepID=UPI00142A6659|nr:D-glycero-beta-D-manno-heptose 1-phosphate adenylyltransferase [Thermocrinis sp.]MDT7871759.1 D-glycero-beta-D-manno-heptose 1-phosphate adenylyltransferase [Thermocrinis sp.]MDT7911775.1 D-glycero-beta-D-manno-heptose 1-phosphate adenylyltransferase [Thermocrinis sp.]NAZ06394.1 D-glycero-beta-D-manno-heptose 1-phosphate adenylyltransferase [Thermocrinis sp.]
MIVELKELLELLEKVRGKKKIVFTNGCFDILHAGHADYLNKAKSLGDILVVGINSDASVRRIKGEKRPILPQQMRAYLLDNLKPVDYVVIFEEDTPLELIKAIKPDVLVKGADWDLERIVGADFVLSYGGRVERIPFSFDISTSKVVERILDLYCK